MTLRETKHTMRWLKPILSVLMVSLLLCTLLCTYVVYELEKNVIQSNLNVASYMQRNIDSNLEKVYHYSDVVGLNRENIFLKNLREPPQKIPQEAYRLSEFIQNYLVTNQLAQSVYIYYPHADLVVGNMGCFQTSLYYALKEYPAPAGEEEWLRTLLEKRDAGFILMHSPQKQLCYIRQTEVLDEILSVMVIEVNHDQLLQGFDPAGLPQTSAMAVMYQGEPVAHTGSPKLLNSIPRMYDQWARDRQENIKDGGAVGFFHLSQLSGIEYVTICSSYELLRSVWLTLMVCVVGAIGCLIFDVMASVVISCRNSRPMKNLLTKLGAERSETEDEYQIIMNKFAQIQSEKSQNEARILQHQSLLNGMFLHTVLRGGIHSESMFFTEAKRYEINFDHPNYQILVLAGVGRDVTDTSPGIELMMHDLEILGYEALTCAYGGRYVVLLNTEECLNNEVTEQIAKVLLDQVFRSQPAHAGIGPCYDSMADILTSYNCALMALKVYRPECSHPVGHYDQSLIRRESGDAGTMQDFYRCVYSKEFVKAQQLLDRLYSEYLYCGGSSASEQMRQNAVDCLLADAMLQVLPPDQAEREIQALTSSGSPDVHRRQTERALQVLTQAVPSDETEKTPVAVRAKRIIDENYTDSMMGLYVVSEQLGVSNSYLSTTFKATYGVSLISYINRLRVDRAKELIVHTDKSIKEIALEVGFSSDINFIRVFKKLENLTPTTLRREKTL